MKLLCTTVFTLAITTTALATTWTVDDDGKADFDNIQAAVDAASDGDEIVVMPGTYAGTGGHVVSMNAKALTLRSSDGPDTTIIDGENARQGVVSVKNATVQGFTITRGANNGGSGGGMLLSGSGAPSVINCIFTGNSARYSGGGLSSGSYCFAYLQDCIFEGNNITDPLSGYGGGVGWTSASNFTIVDCTFKNNHGKGYGGGASIYHGLLSGCIFENNFGRVGGGAWIVHDANVTLTNCTFLNNSTDHDGGGIKCNSAGADFIDCTFANNTATYGGGAYNSYSGAAASYLNCTFTGNSASGGGGIQNVGSGGGEFTNCLIEGNSGDGIKNDNAFPTIIGCVIRNNSSNGVKNNNSISTISDSIICGNVGEQVVGDWTDAGGNTISDLCDDDGDGVADETDNCYLYNPDQTDCNGNGVGDICDINDLYSLDINGNDIPDECECLADINADGVTNTDDLLTLIANWGNSSGLGDVNFDGIVDVSDILIVVANWGPCE